MKLTHSVHIRERSQSNRCFNCNSVEHSFKQCPEPRNPALIKANRKHFQNESSGGTTNSARFFVELGLREAVEQLTPGKLSQQLQDALSMQGSEPPYYQKIREYGYPPGYSKCEDELSKRHDDLT